MKIELLVSAVIFISSSFLGLYTYRDIRTINQPNSFSIQGINLGKNHYAIRKNNQCLAWFNTDFTMQQEMTLAYSGAFKFNFKDQEYLSRVKGWAFFNAFEQLVHAELNVDFADLRIEVQTKNTNPVDVSLLMTSNQEEIKKSFQVPGPIMIKKDNFGKYFVDLNFVASIFPAVQSAMLNYPTMINQDFEVLNNNNFCNQPQDLEKTWEIYNLNIFPFNIIQ